MIVSTDPAHNLSDAFCQKIGREPTPIHGFDNLCAMEIDANDDMEEMQRSMEEVASEDDSGLQSLMTELTSSIPGIDEAMSFSELMKQVQNLDFDVVVFDTAPTGHTLRLLSFPTILEKALGKVMELKDRFGGLIGQASAMFGGGNPGQVQDMLLGRLEETRAVINKVNDAFQDPSKTTFVSHDSCCVVLVYDCESSHHPYSHQHCNFFTRFAFVFLNSFPFTRQNVSSKSSLNLVLILTTLLLTKCCFLKRMQKNLVNGLIRPRRRCPRKLLIFVENSWLGSECKISILASALICMEMIFMLF